MNGDATLAERYYGTTQAVPAARRLTVGPWSALFVQGALRDIRHGGVEIIRSIAYLVRDRDWGTCIPETGDMAIVERDGAFRIAYDATCQNPEGHVLRYRIAIECEAQGVLTFHAACTAQTGFVTTRCGFCVLHPIDGVAGVAARVEHSDGTFEDASFPAVIDPWQPFMDIRSIEYGFASGQTVRCELLGDVFEMEDQRNWSDASFKTYSRPLALPWPYVLPAGEVDEQTVRLVVKADEMHGASADPGRMHERNTGHDAGRSAGSSAGSSVDGKPEEAVIRLSPRPGNAALPALGIAVAPAEVDEVLANLQRLTTLAPQRLLLHFDPVAGHGLPELRKLAALVRRSGLPAMLECALPGVNTPGEELDMIANLIAQAALPLTGIIVSPSVHRQSNPPGSISPPCPPLDEVYRAARRAFPALRLGGGMLSYFTELNRKRPPLEMVDLVTHATCPIVHAADDRSVMETLEAVPHITRSCRALIGARPYVIGPVSIGMRQNPYGSRVMPNPERERIAMAEDDPRQHGLFGAAWLAGYAAALADADLECLTLGALTGPRGLLGGDGRPWPVHAIAIVLARLAGAARIECRSTRRSDIAAFAGRTAAGATTLVVANLTPAEQRCRIDLSDAAFELASVYQHQSRERSQAGNASATVETRVQAHLTMIDEQSFMQVRNGALECHACDLTGSLLTLRPFGCAVIEWGGPD